MVNDLLETTSANLAGIETIEDVRAADRPLAAFSPPMAARERRLKAFMYERLYHHAEQLKTANLAKDVIARLYAAFDQDPTLMSAGWADRLPAAQPDRGRHIADYIAGMTDGFAIAQYARIFGQVPEGLSNV